MRCIILQYIKKLNSLNFDHPTLLKGYLYFINPTIQYPISIIQHPVSSIQHHNFYSSIKPNTNTRHNNSTRCCTQRKSNWFRKQRIIDNIFQILVSNFRMGDAGNSQCFFAGGQPRQLSNASISYPDGSPSGGAFKTASSLERVLLFQVQNCLI